MQKTSAFSLFFLMTFLLTPLLAADDGPVIVSFQSNQKALLSSDFGKRLLALPEWEPFFDAFTKACDKGFDKEKQRLLDKLPDAVAADLRKEIDKGLTTRKLIEGYFNHIEAIVFELRADYDRKDIDENLKDLFDILQGRKRDIELDFDGFLAVLLDIDPRDGLWMLKYLREGKDYKFLHNNPGGDFIIDFDFKVHGREIEFCLAGIALPPKGDTKRYAILLADDEHIASLCESFKTGRHSRLDLSAARKELALEETCFLFLERQRQRFGWDSGGAEFFGKIKRVSTAFRDVDGVSRFELNAAMRSKEDAVAARDLLKGMLALAQLSRPENSPTIKLLQAIKVDAEKADVTVAVKLDSPELWKELARGLAKATEEMKKKL